MEYKNNYYNIIDLKEYFLVLKRRKYIFLSIFIIVFILNIFVFFMINKGSQYSVQSQISISESNKDYQELISKAYPDDANKLWLISSEYQFIPKYFDEIIANIRNDKILEKVSSELNNKYKIEDLKKQIKVESVLNQNKLTVTVFYDNPQEARIINNKLLEVYNNEKKIEFNNYYSNLLNKIENKLNEKNTEYEKLSKEAEKYVLDINKEILNSLSNKNDKIINFYGVNFLSPVLENNLNEVKNERYLLKNIYDNLENNKDSFINRMIITELPDIEKNINIFSIIIISFAIAIFSSLLLGNLINSIIVLKSKNNK